MAHIPGTFDIGHHISDPDRILQVLRDLDGFNYLNNADYRIAGVGAHLYPTPDETAESLRSTIRNDSHAGGDLPVWVTEWSFRRRDFETRRDKTRVDAIDGFYDMLSGSPVPLGPNFFYTFSERTNTELSLVNIDGQELPEAFEITRRVSEQNPSK